jgi:hypothetical protein
MTQERRRWKKGMSTTWDMDKAAGMLHVSATAKKTRCCRPPRYGAQ